MSNIDHLFQHTDQDAYILLGHARFQRYVDDTHGKSQLAICLCRWNQNFAGTLHSQLGYVELAVRNALDHELRLLATDENMTPDWCLPGNAPDAVIRLIRKPLRDAYNRALQDAARRTSRATHRNNNTVVHDDVLGQLMWGSSVKMIGDPETSDRTAIQQTLWASTTHKAFPNVPNSEQGRLLTAKRLDYIRQIRNRAAHFDNLFTTANDINRIIGTAIAILQSINTRFNQGWIDTAALRQSARELRGILATSSESQTCV